VTDGGGAGSRLEVIPYDECLKLLERTSVGRIGGVWDGEPHVVPVNYRWDGSGVLFRTDPGLTLKAVAEGPVVFEVDGYDSAAHTGWSVIVRGRGREVDASEAADALRKAHTDLEPWAPGSRDHWVRIEPDVVSGRRITRDDSVGQWWRLPAAT
jgi:nitroimidazol reductase NimA-like FMN-containing flavoprotein (pyridoxamine 5'-phosphate oxidase superfamily)